MTSNCGALRCAASKNRLLYCISGTAPGAPAATNSRSKKAPGTSLTYAGFLTGEVALQRVSGETEPLVAVYVPTNHLYLGDILLVRREEVILTRLTVPQGIQIVLSGGISIPHVLRQELLRPGS